jgi:large subunit ribosomal protein L25
MQDNRTHLAAKPRTVFGKKVRFLRREGWVPANVFGGGSDSVSVQLSTRETEHLLTHVPRNTLLALDLEGTDETVLIKGVSRKPTTGELYHLDLYRISMTETLRLSVPIVFTGESPAAKRDGATILHALGSVEIECLPADIPNQITVDLERLADIDDAIYVRDLQIPARATVITPEDELIAKALAPSVAEAAAETEAGEEAAAEAAPTEEAAEEEAPAAESEEA